MMIHVQNTTIARPTVVSAFRFKYMANYTILPLIIRYLETLNLVHAYPLLRDMAWISNDRLDE